MRGISRRARIITALFVGVCAYLAAAVTAHAVAYCMIPGLYLCNGCTANATWKVVVSSYPRHEIIPGVKNNRIWCRETRSSLGGHSRNKIVTAPKLGVLRANGYDIRYKGDRVGHDRFVIERTWLGPMNTWYKGTLVYDIDVVPTPF